MQHRANMVVHLNTPWEPDLLAQSTARVYRNGQKHVTTIFRPTGSDIERLIEASVHSKIRESAKSIGKEMVSDAQIRESIVMGEELTSDAVARIVGIDPELLRGAKETPRDVVEAAMSAHDPGDPQWSGGQYAEELYEAQLLRHQREDPGETPAKWRQRSAEERAGHNVYRMAARELYDSSGERVVERKLNERDKAFWQAVEKRGRQLMGELKATA